MAAPPEPYYVPKVSVFMISEPLLSLKSLTIIDKYSPILYIKLGFYTIRRLNNG